MPPTRLWRRSRAELNELRQHSRAAARTHRPSNLWRHTHIHYAHLHKVQRSSQAGWQVIKDDVGNSFDTGEPMPRLPVYPECDNRFEGRAARQRNSPALATRTVSSTASSRYFRVPAFTPSTRRYARHPGGRLSAIGRGASASKNVLDAERSHHRCPRLLLERDHDGRGGISGRFILRLTETRPKYLVVASRRMLEQCDPAPGSSGGRNFHRIGLLG